MAPPVDNENHAKSVNVDTSEIWSKFKTAERIIAAAWQHKIGINKRSNMSHGKSVLVDAGTNDVRLNEPRLNEPRRSERRRISLFCWSKERICTQKNRKWNSKNERKNEGRENNNGINVDVLEEAKKRKNHFNNETNTQKKKSTESSWSTDTGEGVENRIDWCWSE